VRNRLDFLANQFDIAMVLDFPPLLIRQIYRDQPPSAAPAGTFVASGRLSSQATSARSSSSKDTARCLTSSDFSEFEQTISASCRCGARASAARAHLVKFDPRSVSAACHAASTPQARRR
jgi:hypothetical protein